MTEPEPAPEPACPTCGGPVPADAPSGACPRCLLGAGIPTGGRAGDRGAPDADEVAAKFPDYEILGFLGRGGMGVVWKARHRGLDRVVALKVLPPDVARVPGFADRFRREARALARLTHENIVGVHEFGDRDGTFFLVMEYVGGLDMRRALREGRIGPADALRIVPQICDALQYAHDHGVVHRDIKPENILVCGAADPATAEPSAPPAGATGLRVKVADFGLAKIVGGESSADLTMAGQVMGTPAYMAPEQVERPLSVDHRADIYSLGVVFYEMLTGELPLGRFDAPSKRVQVDVRFDEVVLRSLEKAPERRWQRADEVKSEVGAIAAGPAAAPVPAPAPAVTQGTDAAQAAAGGAALTAAGGTGSRLPPSTFGLSELLGLTDRARLFALRLLIGTSAAASVAIFLAAFRGESLSRAVFGVGWAVVCVLAIRRHAGWIGRLRGDASASPGAPSRVPADGDAARAPAAGPRAGQEPAPSGRPRINRYALAGASLLFLVAVAAATALAAEMEVVAAAVLFAGAGAVVVACVLGIIAWVQIARSRGAQRGVAFAAICVFSPLLGPCVAGPMLFFLGRADAPLGSLSVGVDDVPHRPVTEEPTEFGFVLKNYGDWPAAIRARDAREVHDLWTKYVANAGAAVASKGDAGLYSERTWKRLDVVGQWPSRSAEWLAGTAGLPLMDPNRLGGPVTTARVESVELFSDRSRGHLRVRCGPTLLSVPLERDANRWTFAVEPVLALEMPAAPPVFAGTSLVEPIDTREQAKDLWFALQEAHPRVTVSDLKRWYSRADWPRVGAEWTNGGAEAAASGGRGLPLVSESTLGEPLSAFHGWSLAVDEGARTAECVVSSDRHRVRARMRFAESSWRFTADPVTIETIGAK